MRREFQRLTPAPAAGPDMTDYFALLDEPRRPWLDPDALKQKFLALSASAHPDRLHNAPEDERREADRRFSELNAAYNCLREPKDRLRHLLELERGARPPDVQRVPPEMTDAFFEIGRLCKETDAFLREKAAAASPLLQVRFFERAQEWIGKLEAVQRDLDARRAALLKELREMNAAWDESPALRGQALERIAEIHRLLGFFGRWSDQLRERVLQLSF